MTNKQEVVISVPMGDAKKKSKALGVVVEFPGVTSAKVENGKVIVVGEGIDSVKLTLRLRKKMSGHADIVSVKVAKEEKEDNYKPLAPATVLLHPSNYWSSYPYSVPQVYYEEMSSHRNDSYCNIM